jgi:heptaprenyl diphosphate synthase
MTSIHKEINRSCQQIRELAQEPYLDKIIGKPQVPVFFVQLLHFLLESYGLPRERVHVFTVATTLLKMGLDLHDRVTEEKEVTVKKMRERQLFVLAGDYYSSLFYRFLAANHELEGIDCLAQATSRINEVKMQRHFDEGKENDLKYRHLIESKLLTALADFFHVVGDLNQLWRQLLSSLTLLHLLKNHYADQLNGPLLQEFENGCKKAREAAMRLPNGEVKNLLLERINQWSMKMGDFSLVKGG